MQLLNARPVTAGSTIKRDRFMSGNKILLAAVILLIVVGGLFYVMSSGNDTPDQQPSPHAIDQPG